MIEVSNLSKKYGDRVAINNISFSLKKGEVLGLLGPNGAGKTTTMKIITGCLFADKGTVKIDQKNIISHPLYTKSKIGYLPELPPVYEEMTVAKYLTYIARLKRCSRKEIPALVEEALKQIDLLDVRSRLIGNLSKGYKQRVGLAGAIVSNPEVLILDEPTVGLDPAQVIEIRNLIHKSKKNRAVIISSHILSEIEANCDKALIINKGEIISQGSIQELKQKVQSKNITIRVQNENSTFIEDLKSISGITDVRRQGDTYNITASQNINSKLAKFIVNQGVDLLELKEDRLTLEDAFIHLTKKSLGS